VEETQFRRLVQAHRWTTYPAFLAQFHRTARLIAERDVDPRLATLTVSEKTFKRWLAGQVRTQPRPDVVRVLEVLFDQPIDALFHGLQIAAEGSAAVVNGPCAERQIHMAARRALRFSTLVLGSELSSDAIELLHEEAVRISLAYAVEPLPRLISDLTGAHDTDHYVLVAAVGGQVEHWGQGLLRTVEVSRRDPGDRLVGVRP